MSNTTSFLYFSRSEIVVKPELARAECSKARHFSRSEIVVKPERLL